MDLAFFSASHFPSSSSSASEHSLDDDDDERIALDATTSTEAEDDERVDSDAARAALPSFARAFDADDARDVVRRARMASSVRASVEIALDETKATSYYDVTTVGEGKEVERRAVVVADARRVRDVIARVARRMTTDDGNGMFSAVRKTGARVIVETLEEEGDGDGDGDGRGAGRARVAVVGNARSVEACMEILDSLVREEENSVMKRFYVPKVALGAFIGRGRGGLNKIEGVSKCRVVISDEDKVHEGQTHAVVRAVEVRGTPTQVALGYKLALQRLDEALQTTPDEDAAREAVRESGLDIDEARKKKKPKAMMRDHA